MGFQKPHKSGEMERKKKNSKWKTCGSGRGNETEEREQRSLKKSFLKHLYFDNLLIYPRKTVVILYYLPCFWYGLLIFKKVGALGPFFYQP